MTVDPEVLGGASVRVGSDLYDGTVLRRLNETRNAHREALTGSTAQRPDRRHSDRRY